MTGEGAVARGVPQPRGGGRGQCAWGQVACQCLPHCRIAALAPGAARLSKQPLWALKMPLALDGRVLAAIKKIANVDNPEPTAANDPSACADSAIYREGISAFLAKRPPVF